jgi:hypothetical protein
MSYVVLYKLYTGWQRDEEFSTIGEAESQVKKLQDNAFLGITPGSGITHICKKSDVERFLSDHFLRTDVKVFALEMESQLQKHDKERGGDSWKSLQVCSDRLHNLVDPYEGVLAPEFRELLWELKDNDGNEYGNPEEIIRKCANIANYLMMLSDRVKSC